MLPRKPLESRNPVIQDDVAFIPLASGKGIAVVDVDCLPFIGSLSWSHSNGYAVAWYDGGISYMHRLITNCSRGYMVDHINKDTLDNRRCNLYVCTQRENQQNRVPVLKTSKYKGVCWTKRERKWRATIMVRPKYIHIGYFDIEEDAAKAYDAKALDLGWPAYGLNFPEDYDKYVSKLTQYGRSMQPVH